MKIKRYKKIQRNIGFFEKNFGFRTPYQILIDGTFANAALQNKVNIKEQLPKYLNASVKVLTTPCAITETEEIGPMLAGVLNILRRFPIHKCSHKEKPVPASKCLKSMVSPDNSSRYVIASQDVNLREALREIPGVALLYLHGNAPTLEAPSEKSVQAAQEKSTHKTDVIKYQKDILDHLKKGSNIDEPDVPKRLGTKKRKRAGPNPLSCKKSKKSVNVQSTTNKSKDAPEVKKSRRRPKLKTPQHVKEVISKSKSS